MVIGAGDIGGEFAKRLKALGSYTIGARRSNAGKPDYLDEFHFMDELEDLLPRADIVAVSLPATNRKCSCSRISCMVGIGDGLINP